MQSYIDHDYVQSMELAYVVGLLAIGGLAIVLKRRNSVLLFSLLPLLATLAHQTEEYVLSPLLLGDEMHFLNWAYRTGVVVTPLGVVVINSIGWVLASTLLFFKPFGRIWTLLNLFILSTIFANAMFHLGVATAESAYNPGAVTSLFAYMPLYVLAIVYATRAEISPRIMIALSAYGFIAHFLLIWLVPPLL